MSSKSVAFVFYSKLKEPMHKREFYISQKLIGDGVNVVWFSLYPPEHFPIPDNVKFLGLKELKKNKENIITHTIELCSLLRKENIDFLWINGWFERYLPNLLRFFLLLRLHNIRIIYDTIDPIIEYEAAMGSNQNKLKNKILMYVIYKLSNIILVVTDELAKIIIRKGVNKKKVIVAPWGTSFDNKEPIDSQIINETDIKNKFVIGWLGSMTSFKCIEEIIIPLIEDYSTQIDDIYFMIGGNGPLFHLFETSAVNAPDKIKLFGQMSYKDAYAFTKTLNVYVIPINTTSKFGQSIRPVKLFDALSCGIPVLVTKTKATESLSSTFPSMTLCENDLDNFKTNLHYIYNNYSSIKKMAVADAAKSIDFTQHILCNHIVENILDKI